MRGYNRPTAAALRPGIQLSLFPQAKSFATGFVSRCFVLQRIQPCRVATERKTFRYGEQMARYSQSTRSDVGRALRRRKKGSLKRGKGGRGGAVKSKKQAIAIGLSEARKKGKKVPRKR